MEVQKNTLSLTPEYLKTKGVEGITNLSDYTIPLGRRFRALKLWFLIRSEGLSGIRKVIRNHITWSDNLYVKMKKLKNIEIVTEPILGLFTFRFINQKNKNLDLLNEKLIKEINDDGLIYLTPTKVEGKFFFPIKKKFWSENFFLVQDFFSIFCLIVKKTYFREL